MSFVTHFKQYLSEKSPEKNRECLTLYNYLRCFCHNEQVLTQDTFTDFYRKVLLFPYWQSHFVSLQKTLKTELTSFAKIYQPLDFDPEEITSGKQWQLVNLQTESDLKDVVHSHLYRCLSPGDQMKVLPLNTQRALALVLKFDGSLNVFSFGPLSIINQGKIEPLTPLSELHYSSQYELKPTHQQIIEDTKLNFISFRVKDKKVSGNQHHSFCFQQSNIFKNKNIYEVDALFSLLKKIESLFIQAKSDPHYKQLIKLLHEHYRQLLVAPLNQSLETQAVLSQAKKAIKNLYPHDRLLFLLTANIDFHFRKKQKNKPVASASQ